jgi:hypothetical protein
MKVSEDDATLVGEPVASDLVVHRFATRMTVQTADGRRLEARFRLDADAPQVAADAPQDLRDALVRAWRASRRPGRPSEQEARLEAIIAKAAETYETATRFSVAAALGRVKDGFAAEEATQFKDDVTAVGGWEAIMRLAAERRR